MIRSKAIVWHTYNGSILPWTNAFLTSDKTSKIFTSLGDNVGKQFDDNSPQEISSQVYVQINNGPERTGGQTFFWHPGL